MKAEKFLDTNILVYAASNDPADRERRVAARRILAEPGVGISAQVVQEFYHAATRKDRLGISHDAAMRVIARLSIYPVLPITYELVAEAAEASRRYCIGYFDAAILAAARRMGCSVVYSEDLHHDQDYDGVRVRNPFLTTSM